jgi:hypothetical protein
MFAPPLLPPVAPTGPAPEEIDPPLDGPPVAPPPDAGGPPVNPPLTVVWLVLFDPVALGRPFDEAGWPPAEREPEFADVPPLMVF